MVKFLWDFDIIYMMKIRENVPIAELTTMRLGGAAEFVVTIETPEEIPQALDFADERDLPIWMMGGGANTIGRDGGFDGVVILNQIRGIEIIEEDTEILKVRAMSGEVWDDLVEFACKHEASGIEALSKIPGTVGAAPVQNIGAYGQDVAGVIETVEAYDTRERDFVTLAKDEMNLGYRTTRFNTGEDAGRFLIYAVTLKLTKTTLQPPFYNSLQRYIDEHEITDFSPMNIRQAVSAIRSEKLPDPTEKASAGSFFKNVFVDQAGADAAEAKGIPVWRDAQGGGKINSGWLIEACGLKGKELYGFRVSEKAALVLINEKAQSYAELARARAEIVETIRKKFGYTLQQEPVEIGEEK